MRHDLRRALEDLSREPGGQLYAVYAAADDGALVDVENVLLYNVGGIALWPLMSRSVVFERSYTVPPPPDGDEPRDFLHYRRYRTAANETSFEFWKPGRLLGAFSDVPVTSFNKPAPVWKAIRDHAAPPAETADAPTRFLVDVQITDTQSSGTAQSVAGMVKPLLDGIVSAYHCHEGSDTGIEARRLEVGGPGTARVLCEQLLDPRWAALGPRRLVRPFGASGVQWNPADEFCVAARITLNAGDASDGHAARWRLSATLAEAVPSP